MKDEILIAKYNLKKGHKISLHNISIILNLSNGSNLIASPDYLLRRANEEGFVNKFLLQDVQQGKVIENWMLESVKGRTEKNQLVKIKKEQLISLVNNNIWLPSSDK